MITVLFTIDGKFSQHLGVCIASLLESNPQSQFSLIVASPTAIHQDSLAALETVTKLGNATIHNVVHDATPYYKHLPIHSHLQPIVYLRLFMTEYVDQTISKLIFLDSDVIVCDDIRDLWATDLSNAYLGAAPEPYNEKQRAPLGFGPEDLYINAGVMVVNLAKWRSDNVLSQFLDFANSNQKILHSLDQDIMNSVFRGHIVNVGYKWNWQALFPRFTPEQLGLSAEEFGRLLASPSIVHYTSHYKPWYYRWAPHYKELYIRSLRKTPWADYVPPDKTLNNVPIKLVKILQRKLEWYFPKVARNLRLRLRSAKAF